MSARPRDSELLERVGSGDNQALSVLYERYAEGIYAVAYRLTGSEEDAADVLQDVFVGLPEALRSYRGAGSFKGWLEKIAARASLLRKRQQKRRGEIYGQAANQVTAANQPDRVVDRIAVQNALDALPDEQRQVFVLKEIEGYSHGEIAAMLGVTAGYSATILYRARHTLRESLGDPR